MYKCRVNISTLSLIVAMFVSVFYQLIMKQFAAISNHSENSAILEVSRCGCLQDMLLRGVNDKSPFLASRRTIMYDIYERYTIVTTLYYMH